jgi:DNA-binding NtrC family response regulator
LAAEWVFQASDRGQRVLKINCASLSESVIESELFGHERGAYTGAHAARAGIFETVDGGSLFLDEVGELPLSTQAKLLRVLELGELVRLGGTTPRKVDVRIVSATHRNLPERIASGLFRQDLYFRLNGVSVCIPPLRARPMEILPLARLFVEKCAHGSRLPATMIAPEAEQALLQHTWPGNIRELRNVIERAVALCHDGCVLPEHLELPQPQECSDAARSAEQTPSRPPNMRSVCQSFEREQIRAALEQTSGNQTQAALLLGISRRALTNKLNVHGLPRPRKR